MSCPTLLLLALLLAGTISLVEAFSFNTSTPTQCGQWTVQWDAGTAPFYLVLVPTISVSAGRILNISIPTTLSPPYTYTFTLNEPSGLQFLATMYDSTGWGAGGTTDVLTVGSSSNNSCLDYNLLYDFYFSISPESSPAQCSTMNIEWNNNVTYPVHLYGLIPHGTPFSLPIPQVWTEVSYDWSVDIANGTDFLLLMSDSGQYQTGGSTSLLTVSGGSTNCMNASSPASATTSTSSSINVGSSSTFTSSSSASATASVDGVGGSSSGGSSGDNSSSPSSSSSGSRTGAIIGGVLGGVAFLFLLCLFLFCYIRRRSRRSRGGSGGDSGLKSYGVSSGEKRRGLVSVLGERSSGDTGAGRTSPQENNQVEVNGEWYEPSPFRYPSPPGTPGGAANDSSAALDRGRAAGVAGALGGIAAAEKDRDSRTTTAPDQPSPHIPQTTQTAAAPHPPGTPRTSNGVVGEFSPSAWAASEFDTSGHEGRLGSISKAPRSEQAPGGWRPLPDPPRETLFVQHEDAGEIVDLPPRYDQLRSRNPDSGV